MSFSFGRCLAKIVPLILLASLGAYSKQGTSASGPQPKELVIDLDGGVKLEFVLVRDGSFQMGSHADDSSSDEQPVHTVAISKPFYLGKYEVTQGQWQAVMGSNPSHFKGDKLLVDSVGWGDCQEFLKKLQSRLPALKFFVPTEAQWEYACRAGSKTEYSFGDDASRLGEFAWYSDNSGSTTHDVGTKEPNDWGLYDMHGNVKEWNADWSGEYSAGAQKDPAGPTSGQYRVLRGGSRSSGGYGLRSAYRDGGWSPDGLRVVSGGFRVAAGTFE